MVVIHVGRLAPFNQWDQTLLDDLFANELYPTGLSFQRWDGYPNADGGCVLLIPGRYWADSTDQVTEAIARFDWVLGIRVGDEEDLFDIGRVGHPNIRWWVQSPRTDRDYGDARFIGVGFTPHFRHLPTESPEKRLNVFLSAQNTHSRRSLAFRTLANAAPADSVIQETEGFTQGMAFDKYRAAMLAARVAPAPSGAVCPDSFRLWEALEAHTVPIADDVSPTYDSQGFWEKVCPGAPFPVLSKYRDLPGYINDVASDWPASANRVTAWWMLQKRRYVQWLREDLEALGAL